jgi:hypothetical protein
MLNTALLLIILFPIQLQLVVQGSGTSCTVGNLPYTVTVRRVQICVSRLLAKTCFETPNFYSFRTVLTMIFWCMCVIYLVLDKS